MSYDTDSPPEICEDDDEKKSISNNNRFWCSKQNMFLEMEELGVAMLPPHEYIDDESNSIEQLRRTADRLNADDVYSELAQEDDLEFKSTKKAKYLSPDTFLYKKSTRNENPHLGGPDIFSRMSDEIILYIFSYLGHSNLNVVSRVCKRFKRLARDDSLWSRLDVSGLNAQTDAIFHILNLGVRVLKLTGANIVSPVMSPLLTRRLKKFEAKVEYLDLSEVIVKPEDLQVICSKLYNLKKLSLEACDLNGGILKELAKNKQLDTLNLTMCTGIDTKGMKAIAENCTMLESLNLAWTGISASTVNALVTNINPNLKEINLSGLFSAVGDKDAITLIKRCRHLQELDLSDCLDISQAVLTAVVDNLHDLRSFSVTRCFRINPATLSTLSSLPKLEKLNAFRQITKSNIESIEAELPSVQINKDYFSTVARPCVGIRRTSIWQIRCRE